tara:strand:+ start:81 stop:917 length:837 start_codon:yes stop_codon:yes gene_type:complete
MKCISWNIGKNFKIIDQQLKIVDDEKPDILALQEVTNKSFNKINEILRSKFKFVSFSLDLIKDKKLSVGPRKLGVLTASNYKLEKRDLNEFNIPWRERILNHNIYTDKKKIRFYNAYIPPGSSNGWIKIETLEGIFKGLNISSSEPRILCGDFNIPQAENHRHNVITFAQKMKLKGKPKLKKSFRGGSGKRWDQAERNLFENLKSVGMQDSFRKKHSYKTYEYSFAISRKGKVVAKRRFDHFFTSDDILIKEIGYLHTYRETKLSDHSPIQINLDHII